VREERGPETAPFYGQQGVQKQLEYGEVVPERNCWPLQTE